jgi:hypothetical protein
MGISWQNFLISAKVSGGIVLSVIARGMAEIVDLVKIAFKINVRPLKSEKIFLGDF